MLLCFCYDNFCLFLLSLSAFYLSSTCYFIHSVFCPRSKASLSHQVHSLRHQSPPSLPPLEINLLDSCPNLLVNMHGPAILLPFGSRRALFDSSPSIAQECFTNLLFLSKFACHHGPASKVLYKPCLASSWGLLAKP